MGSIKVRRKRARFNSKFTYKWGDIYMLDAKLGFHIGYGPRYVLSYYGYHAYFRSLFVVFHAATGIPIVGFKTEKEARIKAKRLEAGIDFFDSFDTEIRDWKDTDHDVVF